MAKSKKRSPSGLLSEAGKKAARGVGKAAKKAVGKKSQGKSATGNLSEAGKKAGDIDMVVVRENTEGEYAQAGGFVHHHHPDEVAADVKEMLENLLTGRAHDAVSKAIDDLLNSL